MNSPFWHSVCSPFLHWVAGPVGAVRHGPFPHSVTGPSCTWSRGHSRSRCRGRCRTRLLAVGAVRLAQVAGVPAGRERTVAALGLLASAQWVGPRSPEFPQLVNGPSPQWVGPRSPELPHMVTGPWPHFVGGPLPHLVLGPIPQKVFASSVQDVMAQVVGGPHTVGSPPKMVSGSWLKSIESSSQTASSDSVESSPGAGCARGSRSASGAMGRSIAASLEPVTNHSERASARKEAETAPESTTTEPVWGALGRTLTAAEDSASAAELPAPQHQGHREGQAEGGATGGGLRQAE